MILLLHGEAGGWDELLIATAGFPVYAIWRRFATSPPVPEEEPTSELSAAQRGVAADR